MLPYSGRRIAGQAAGAHLTLVANVRARRYNRDDDGFARAHSGFDIPVDHLFAAVIIDYLARLRPEPDPHVPDAGGLSGRAYQASVDAGSPSSTKQRTDDGTAE